MSTSRREFLKQTALATAALVTQARGQQRSGNGAPPGVARISLSPYALTPYVDPLPRLSLAQPLKHVTNPEKRGAQVPYYRIVARELQAKVHRDVPPATFWGYDGSSPGPVIEARSGEPCYVEWVNELPAKHLLPIDHTLHGAESDMPDVRMVVHLHGGKVAPESDGNPEKWIVPGHSMTRYYPNRQKLSLMAKYRA